MTMFSPLVIGLGSVIGLLLVLLLVYRRARRKAKKVTDNQDGTSLLEAMKGTAGGLVTIILLRGGAPLGKIVPSCQFVNGQYNLDPKSPNPQIIIYDGRYVRNNPDGQPFLFYDVEKQSVVAYAGECSNDDDVTLVFHDGTARDVKASEAEKYKESPHADGAHTVLRKHVGLWRRLGGARLYQEKTTTDWDVIQRTQATWLHILQQYFPIIAIFFFVVLVIIMVVIAVQVT